MKAKNEQLLQSIENLKEWEASTESYDRLVGVAKEIAKEQGEADLYAVISGEAALLSLFCVQMFNIKEILEIFPNHRDAISKLILENLDTLYRMNKNRAEEEVFQFYKMISRNDNLLDQFGINDEHIHFVEYGDYRFFSLLGNLIKSFPSLAGNICDQLLKGKWFIHDEHDNLKSLLRLTGEIFIDSPDCINKILEAYAEIIRNINGSSFVVNHFHMDASKLFKVCLSYSVTNNNHESIPNNIKDKTLQLLLNLFDSFMGQIEKKQNKYAVETMNKAQSKIIKDHPRIKSFAEIRKSSRLLRQDKNLSFFAKLPQDILIKIASHTRNPEVHTETEANKIVCDYFGH